LVLKCRIYDIGAEMPYLELGSEFTLGHKTMCTIHLNRESARHHWYLTYHHRTRRHAHTSFQDERLSVGLTRASASAVLQMMYVAVTAIT
jgi:hypothetical protein